MALKIFTGARGSQFVCDDTRGFGDAVAAISVRADAPIMSCAREEAAEPMLKRIGKMSQKELWKCSLNCRPSCRGNCNPANPPGKSTHERRNDGVAYPRWRVGAWTRYWMRGIDVDRDRVPVFIREAAKEGWLVTQTYPGSPSESQHVNFRRRPRISLWEFRPLTRGMRGPRVREVIRLLRSIQEPGKRTPYLVGAGVIAARPWYDKRREAAVMRFQKDHGLKADGEVGLRTITLLRGQARRPPSRLDQSGVDFIRREEGEVLHLYEDTEGFATFGIGHLVARKRIAQLPAATIRRYGTRGNPLPQAQALRLSREHFDEDAERFERAVRRTPVRWRKSHDRFTALFSVAFNFGEEVLTPSPPLTVLGRALQGKQLSGVVNAWHELRDRNQPELRARRDRELARFRRNK